jgi:hypothetical protein
MVDLHQDNPIAIYNVTKGLAATIQKCKEGYILDHLAITDKIQDMQRQLDIYQETVPLPTSDCLEGFIHNDKSRVPDFVVPCGNGYFQVAY